MFRIEDNTPENRKKVQDLARHTMISKLLADIMMDMQVCELEGWDKTEYIRLVQNTVNSFKVS